MKQLTKLLTPLRYKMIFSRCVMFGTIGLVAGGIFCASVITASKFMLIDDMWRLIVLGFVACLLLGVLVGLVYVPSIYEVAMAGDSLGFKERFVTALELSRANQHDAMSELAINDAIQTAKKAKLTKSYKVKPPKKPLIILGFTIAISLAVGFIESPKAAEFDKIVKTRQEVEKEIKKIDEITAKETSKLTEAEAKELEAKLDELKKQLRKAKNEGEAVRELQKVQSELKKLSNNSVPKDLKALGEKLSQNKNTSKLGESLKTGLMSQVEKELEAFKDYLENATDEELEEYAKALEEAAKVIEENPQLLQAMEQLVQSLQSRDMSSINSKLGQLSGTLNSIASKNSSFRDAINKMNSSLTNASKALQGNKGKSGQSSNGQGEGDGDGSGEGEGSGDGDGSGEGSGDGNGTGSGQGGNGQGGNSNGNPGSGRGTGHVENENVFSRNAQGFGDYEAQVSGAQNEGGTFEQQEVKGIGNAGEVLPYDKVIGNYKDEALKSLDEYDIPGGMKSLVMDYFSSLE